jgi:hypothetical protein
MPIEDENEVTTSNTETETSAEATESDQTAE